MIPNCIAMFDHKGRMITDIADIDDCVLLLVNDPEEANKYFDSLPDLYDKTGEYEYVIPMFEDTGAWGSYIDVDDNYTFADITLYLEVISGIMKNYPEKFIGGNA